MDLPYYTWYRPLIFDSFSNPIFIKRNTCTVYNGLSKSFSDKFRLEEDSDNYTSILYDYKNDNVAIGYYSEKGNGFTLWEYNYDRKI